MHAVAPDTDSREIFKGVAVGNGWIVATDSQRLAAVEAGHLPDEVIIVPRLAIRFVLGLSDLSSCEARLAPGKATFSAGRLAVTTSLIQGVYPNWREAIPEGEETGYVEAKREELVIALRRLGPIGAYAKNKLVRIQPKGTEQLLLTSRAPDLGYQEESISGQTSLKEIGFRIPSLRELAENMESEIIRLHVIDPNRAVVTREERFVGLVMPIRL